MSVDLEDQLRLDMERVTRGIRVTRGLAVKADRHRRKRQKTLRVAITAATATTLVGGVAIAGVTGAFGSAPSPASARTAQLTAYVIRHVRSALAPAAVDNLVGSVRQTYPAGTTLEPVPGGMNAVTGGAASQWSVASSVVWAYRGTTRYAAYSKGGQPVFDAELTHANGAATETAVIYVNSTWWTAPVQTRIPGPVGCLQGGGVYLRPGPGGGWPGFIRSQLACGAYTVVGHQLINQIDTIKLTGSAPGSITLWVDAATYLPLQVTTGPLHSTFTWSAATPASLAPLHISVPARYQQVQPPPSPSH
ncbi:MAG TPA: hypothetical protein VLM11_16970 [Streptosporangiaceae bacterium]|nr:hypothetical protein [Streptosporangiaceae bacterium]